MKITDKTTPTGGMTEERARELLETPGTVFVLHGETFRILKECGAPDVTTVNEARDRLDDSGTEWWASRFKRGELHFRDAELILRDFVEGEG